MKADLEQISSTASGKTSYRADLLLNVLITALDRQTPNEVLASLIIALEIVSRRER